VAHRLAVAELHARVIEGAQEGRYEIEALTPEPNCWRTYTDPGGTQLTLKPDTYARMTTTDYLHVNFIEVDLATESSITIERKMRQYLDYYRSGRENDPFPRAVFIAPSTVRAEVLIEAAGRLPAEAWQLFQVTTFDRALDVMTGINQ
jgi:Replication-relaxation